MYNLSVQLVASYFVGDGQWLVHNVNPFYNQRENKLYVDYDFRYRDFPYGDRDYGSKGKTWQYAQHLPTYIQNGRLPECFHTFYYNSNLDILPNIGGQLPNNHGYTGRNYWFGKGSSQYDIAPLGIDFDRMGFPIFDPYALASVELNNIVGAMPADNISANIALLGSTHTQYNRTELATIHRDMYPDSVWHHVQDGRTMLLLPHEIHSVTRQGVAHHGYEAIHKCKR